MSKRIAHTLKELGLCQPAIMWAQRFRKFPHELWESCTNGNWLLEYAARLGIDTTEVKEACKGLHPRQKATIVRKHIDYKDIVKARLEKAQERKKKAETEREIAKLAIEMRGGRDV